MIFDWLFKRSKKSNNKEAVAPVFIDVPTREDLIKDGKTKELELLYQYKKEYKDKLNKRLLFGDISSENLSKKYLANQDIIIKHIMSNNYTGINEIFASGNTEELLENIRVSIERLKNGEFHFDEETTGVNRCASKEDPSIYYCYEISGDESLIITKLLRNGTKLDELFELMLFPISPEDAKEMENFEEEWIGTVTNNIKTTHINDNFSEIDCNESEYNIYNTPIGHFVGYTREIFNGRRDIVIYKPVSLRRLPEDISKDNILRKKLVPNTGKK